MATLQAATPNSTISGTLTNPILTRIITRGEWEGEGEGEGEEGMGEKLSIQQAKWLYLGQQASKHKATTWTHCSLLSYSPHLHKTFLTTLQFDPCTLQ